MEINDVVKVQVDDAGDLWLHLDGGSLKTSLNISAMTSRERVFLGPPGPIVQAAVSEAIQRIREIQEQ